SDPRNGALWSVKVGLPEHPWYFWQLLTAGFVHNTHDILHIAFNMFSLWLFGRDVEARYGRMEFLRIYLALVVLSSLGWVVSQNLQHADSRGSMIGASGAVTGVMILFVLNFPKRIFYVWGVLPLPAWALGAIFVLMDVSGFTHKVEGAEGARVAYETHLA